MAAKYSDTIMTRAGAVIPGAAVTLLNSKGISATIYQDAALTTPVAPNPLQIVANDDGYLEGYVPDDTYTVQQSYGGVQKTYAGVELYDLSTLSGKASAARDVVIDNYIQPSDAKVNGYPDITNALGRAFADGSTVFGTAGAIYYVNNVVLNGQVFDGRGCLLRDAPGCKWGVKLRGFRPALRNFTFQDQQNYVSTTTLSAAATAGTSTIQVASIGNIAVGDVIFILTSSNEIRWQTYVTSVAGTILTIRDPLSENAVSGAMVETMKAAVVVADADHWTVQDILVENAALGLLTMPDASTDISNRGTLLNVDISDFRCAGWIKAGNCAGIKSYNVKLWGGTSPTFSYTGNGTAGPYSFQYLVYLLRDVTVTVNGIPKVYGTDWTYASQTSIQFLTGHFPNVGAAIEVQIYKCAYRGFVSDQRQANIISGGNTFHAIETLACMLGTTVFAGDLTEFNSLISDSCQYAALTIDTCNSDTLAFTGQTFLGFSGTSLKMFNAYALFDHLYALQVPQSYSYATVGDKMYIDSTSHLKVAAPQWTGDPGATVVTGGRISLPGAQILEARNSTDVAAGSTVYLPDGTVQANFRDAAYRTSIEGYLVKMRVDADTAPGTGQSYTYNVIALINTVLTTIATGSIAGSATQVIVFADYYLPEGTEIGVQLITSAGTPAPARHVVQMYLK